MAERHETRGRPLSPSSEPGGSERGTTWAGPGPGRRKTARVCLAIFLFLVAAASLTVFFAPRLAPAYFGRDYQKFWAHRVNTVEKLALAQRRFPGVELDIVLVRDETGLVLDVNHPPAQSIGLDLGEYLTAAASGGPEYWLDIKNLDAGNADLALAELESLMRAAGVQKDRVIVESGDPKSLAVFSASGFYTSYYLPPLDLDGSSEQDMARQAREIRASALAGGVHAISFPGAMYDFVTRHVVGADLDVDLLTWFPRRSLDDVRDWRLLGRVARDESVKVVLVRFETDFDR